MDQDDPSLLTLKGTVMDYARRKAGLVKALKIWSEARKATFPYRLDYIFDIVTSNFVTLDSDEFRAVVKEMVFINSSQEMDVINFRYLYFRGRLVNDRFTDFSFTAYSKREFFAVIDKLN